MKFRHPAPLFLGFLFLAVIASWGWLPAQEGPKFNRRQFTNADIVGSLNDAEITRGDVEEFVLIRHRQESSKLYLGYEGQGKALEDMALIYSYADVASKAVEMSEDEENWIDRRYRMFVINDYMKSIQEQPVTEEMLRSYYEANPTEFQEPEQRLVRHIFKEVPEGATEEDGKDILEKMQEIRQDLMVGADFAEVAEKESEVQSANEGGSIGWIYPHTVKMRPFVEAAFSLEPGVISPIVKTPYGYHIILVEDTKPAGVIPFDRVVFRGRLEREIQETKARQDLSRYILSISAAATVTTRTLEIRSPGDVLFEVSGEPYTVGHYLKYYTMLPESQWSKAASSGLKISTAMLNEAIIGEIAYRDIIANNRIGNGRLAKARDIAEKWTIWKAYMQQMLEETGATSEDKIATYYEENAPRFIERASVELSRIVIDAELSEDLTIGQRKRAKDRALLRATEVKKRLDEGMDFAEVARQFSDSADKNTGGYLGMISDEEIGPYLENASDPLKPGEVSEPFETRSGYILVKLHSRTEDRVRTLDETRETIAGILSVLAEQEIRGALLQRLKGEGKLTINEDMFR